MVLDIDVDDYDMSMKYTRGLANYIQRELKLFTIESIEEATLKTIANEAKNKWFDKKEDKPKSSKNLDWKRKGEQIKDDWTQK